MKSTDAEEGEENTIMKRQLNDVLWHIGCDDHEIVLFEGQYPLENGMAYNSYVFLDEKVCIMDGMDEACVSDWLTQLDEVLGGRAADYVVVQHVEPDHAAGLKYLLEKFPQMQVVSSAKAFTFLAQFGTEIAGERRIVVNENDTLALGSRTLTFVTTPMVHWPEVIMTYDAADRILFSADGFGKFGTLDTDEEWDCEARRYYFNIVGKYGRQVQAALKKAAKLDIAVICPLHGPVLEEDLAHYLNLYQIWSSYGVETEGVFIAYSSMYGNTRAAALEMAQVLEEMGCPKVAVTDLMQEMTSEAVEDAFRYGKMIVASPTEENALMPVMNDFLYRLEGKGYQNKKVGIIENGSWVPQSGKLMKQYFEGMKNVAVCENMVHIKSSMQAVNHDQIRALAEEILAD